MSAPLSRFVAENFRELVFPYKRFALGNVFRQENSSLFSENIKVDNLDISDYFGLDSVLSGRFSDWDLKINSNLKTLNPDRLYDSFSSDLQLSKNILNITNNDKNTSNQICKNNDLDNPFKNYSLDFGLYGIYDKDDIYTGYGGKIYGNYTYASNFFYSTR